MPHQQATKGALTHGVAREMTGAPSMKNRIPAITREDQAHVVAVVRERHGVASAETLAEVGDDARIVLEALFQPVTRKPIGTKEQGDMARRGMTPPQFERAVAGQAAAAFAAFDTRSSVVDQQRAREAARAWRAKVRLWGRAQGRHVSSTGPLNPKLVADYEAAHGGVS